MTEAKNNTEKTKSGAGKFFLGAAIGAALGALAGKFISVSKDDGEELEDDEDGCPCGEDCDCAEKTEEKPEKKSTEKEK